MFRILLQRRCCRHCRSSKKPRPSSTFRRTRSHRSLQTNHRVIGEAGCATFGDCVRKQDDQYCRLVSEMFHASTSQLGLSFYQRNGCETNWNAHCVWACHWASTQQRLSCGQTIHMILEHIEMPEALAAIFNSLWPHLMPLVITCLPGENSKASKSICSDRSSVLGKNIGPCLRHCTQLSHVSC